MPGNSQRWIALLGRRDGPIDGVADYCTYLSAALGLHGYELETVRVPWAGTRLGRWACGSASKGSVLLQYTALVGNPRGERTATIVDPAASPQERTADVVARLVDAPSGRTHQVCYGEWATHALLIFKK